MKLVLTLSLSAAILFAPAAGLCQKTSTLPVDKAEGYIESQRLNRTVLDKNQDAASIEANALEAWREQQAAIDRANRADVDRYNAQLRADAEATAKIRAATEEETRRYNAAVAAQQAATAAQQAANAAKDREYQAQLASAKAAQEAYQRELADYNACVAGNKSRCKK